MHLIPKKRVVNATSPIIAKMYLQFTFSVTVVSYFSPSFMARLNTTHRKRAPSSSLVGVMVNVLVVWWSFEPPRFTMDCKGVGLPSRYHLRKLNVTEEEERRKMLICGSIRLGILRRHRLSDTLGRAFRLNWKIAYVIVGSGDPPTLLHVNSCFFSSVATTMLPGATSGGCGGVRTVKL